MLGANDGIVSTGSLIVGVAAANASSESILLAGSAGLVAGAMSMAAGEYVSVSSQADTERADLRIEARALKENHDLEVIELAEIYQGRGLDAELSKEVARQLMAHDALGAHARDEIGIVDGNRANPLQAAGSSATTFTLGAALPLLAAAIAPAGNVEIAVVGTSLISLAGLGAISARAGGARMTRASFRVTFWGALAMGLTAIVGRLFDVMV